MAAPPPAAAASPGGSVVHVTTALQPSKDSREARQGGAAASARRQASRVLLALAPPGQPPCPPVPDLGPQIGRLAVWSVTSAKPGNGVELLRDGRDDTYWQSDGTQPHLVNVQFQRKVFLSQVAVHTDYKLDESYTPAKLSVRVGSSFSDLREVKCVDLHEPQGWVVLPLAPEGEPGSCMKGYVLQLAVLANHQNGRDTHIRQVRVFGPRQDPTRLAGHPLSISSPEMAMYATVR